MPANSSQEDEPMHLGKKLSSSSRRDVAKSRPSSIWKERLSRSFSRRGTTTKDADVPCCAEPGIGDIQQSSSVFLNLPGEIRNRIYEYAFTRSTEEILQFLQFGPPTSDASGLLLTCKQTCRETRNLAHDSTVTIFPASVAKDQSGFTAASLPKPWKQTKSCRQGSENRLEKSTIKSLALQTVLFKHPRNSFEDLLHGAPLTRSSWAPEVFFLQVCLCNAIHWLHDHPDFIMPFCIAIERLAMGYRTLKRIVIYYCGREWPTWVHKSGEINFPDIVHGRHLIRGYSGANWNLRAVEKPLEGNCRKRCELSWNYFQAHPGESTDPAPCLHHEITIDYYDSFSVSGVSCVGQRPVLREERNSPKQPSLPEKATSSRSSRVMSGIFKGFYTNWSDPHYDPDAGVEYRGSRGKIR